MEGVDDSSRARPKSACLPIESALNRYFYVLNPWSESILCGCLASQQLPSAHAAQIGKLTARRRERRRLGRWIDLQYSEAVVRLTRGKGTTVIRSPQRELVPDIVGAWIDESTSLSGIVVKAKSDTAHRFGNGPSVRGITLGSFDWNGPPNG